jgi:ABC-2 type transport system permease protein
VLSTVIRGPDAVLDDRLQGTLHRLRLGVVPVPALVAVRWWVFVVEGTAEALAVVLVVGPAIGEAGAVPRLLAAAPLFLLIATTTSALGFAVAAFSVTQRADVVITNLVSYLTMLACGVVAPLSALGGFGAGAARALPLTNGLLAIRALIDGRPWIGDAALEAAVGLGWLLVGIGLLQLQLRRAQKLGRDERL